MPILLGVGLESLSLILLFKSILANATTSWSSDGKYDQVILSTEEKNHQLGQLLEKLNINDIKGALSGLRQFLVTEKSLKMMKNSFHFTLKDV